MISTYSSLFKTGSNLKEHRLRMSTRSAPQCVDCGKVSPPTETNYTLISSRHGWRLTIERDENGARKTTWRCPQCWLAHKNRGGAE